MGGLLTRQARERERRDELLSAYLDGQLDARERARLEAQLATDPALEADLAALQHTVALVRDLPSVPVPRNFILPQTAAARPQPARRVRPRRAWAAPFLTAATAVVSLAFVVVLAGEMLLLGSGGMAFGPEIGQVMEAPQAAWAPPVEEAVAVETVVVEAEMEKVVPAPTEFGMPAAEVPAAEVPAAEVPVAEVPAEAPQETPLAAAQVAEDEGESAEAGVPPEPGMGGGGPSEETATPVPAAAAPLVEATAAPAPTPSPPVVEEAADAQRAPATATAASEEGVNLVTPTPGQVGELVPRVEEKEGRAETEGEQYVREEQDLERVVISPWRVVEIVLGLTALGLALATVWAWRARRR
jgi:hypothetical protein